VAFFVSTDRAAIKAHFGENDEDRDFATVPSARGSALVAGNSTGQGERHGFANPPGSNQDIAKNRYRGCGEASAARLMAENDLSFSYCFQTAEVLRRTSPIWVIGCRGDILSSPASAGA